MNRRQLYAVGGCALFALLAIFFSAHRSYSPGPLLHGHHEFAADCASCHQPWHGVSVASTGCIDCHGDLSKNPHAAAFLDDSSGLIKGKVIPAVMIEKDKERHEALACMSCHTDHRGRVVNLAATSGGNCAFCHQHDSIAGVSAHGVEVKEDRVAVKKSKQEMRLEGAALHIFAGTTSNGVVQLFSHKSHLQDTIEKLGKTKERAQKMRPGKNKDKAETDIAALTAVLDSSGQHLNCKSCHAATPAEPGKPEHLSFVVATCEAAGCHSGFHDDSLKLEASAPDFQLQQNAQSAPTEIQYVAAAEFQHVEASFTHSPGHLKSNCVDCHSEMEKSDKPGDSSTKKVINCFSCHAHQLGAEQSAAKDRSRFLAVAVANADERGASKVTACADCHRFHAWYQGGALSGDFPKRAPTLRPHAPAGLRLSAFAFGLIRRNGRAVAIEVHPVTLNVWWMSLVAIALSGLSAFVLVRVFPADLGVEIAKTSFAPQRTSEVPELDDSYQSSVPGLYVVGETAGTASINLAMRSGRQAAEFIANTLKTSKAEKADDVYDIVVAGAGPAGISAAATAKSHGLSYVAIEKASAASTIRDYPRDKLVQATPLTLTEYGEPLLMAGDFHKETLVARWEQMLNQLKLDLKENDEVIEVKRGDSLFEVKTASGQVYKALYVILAIGVRGTPRKLGLLNETADRCFNKLIEPEKFQGRNILVVGGGNAGAEVAQSLAAPELGNKVSFSFRDPVLGPPVTPENAEKISALQAKGLLVVLPSTQLKEIRAGKVVLETRGGKGAGVPPGEGSATTANAPIEIDNDFVFAMLGAELPTKFLKSIGMRTTRKGQ